MRFVAPLTATALALSLPTTALSSPRRVRLNGDCTINAGKGDRVAKGKDVEVRAKEVVLDAVAVDGNVIIRGGSQVKDAVALNGSVTVEDGALVTGDVVALGGALNVSRGARVDGNRVAFGRDLVVQTKDGESYRLSMGAAGTKLLRNLIGPAMERFRHCDVNAEGDVEIAAAAPGPGAAVVPDQAQGVTKLELHTSFDVRIRDGAPFHMQSEEAETMTSFTTSVNGDTLVVRESGSRGRSLEPLEISLPELRGVAAYGAGDVEVTSEQRRAVALSTSGSGDLHFRGPAEKLRVGATGSGDVLVELTSDADSVEVGTKGSGDVEIQGAKKAGELVVACVGSGDIDADDLTAQRAKLATAGSGDIEVTLGGGDASFAVAGSGDITWHGSAKVQSQVRSGSGEIHHD